MNSRERFFSAFERADLDRPPFWVMRQAGRYLPEYRELKEKNGFLGIVHTPELVAEATIQPIRRFGFDCAILFCDILALAEALGFPYRFKEGGGIELLRTVRDEKDVESIVPSRVREKLSYVAEALSILRRELPDRALLGFCASPFTLASYMVSGGGGNFEKFLEFVKSGLFKPLMEVLTKASAEYMKMQSECGIDGFQIFDSNAALAENYRVDSGAYISELLSEAGRSGVKSILFAPGSNFEDIFSVGADAYSLDSSANLPSLSSKYGYVLQGNLDPSSLSSDSPSETFRKTSEIVAGVGSGHIFNLGHGIRPDAKLENVEAMCEAVKTFRKSR